MLGTQKAPCYDLLVILSLAISIRLSLTASGSRMVMSSISTTTATTMIKTETMGASGEVRNS